MAIFDLGTETEIENRKNITSQDDKSQASIQPSTSVTDPTMGSNTGHVKIDPTDAKEKKDIKIVLDGPLSQIYTQALNLVYAKEDTGQMLAQVIQQEINQHDQNEIDGNDIYIYCCDGTQLNQADLVESADKLKRIAEDGHYKEAILAVECGSLVNSKISLLDSFAKQLGMKVFFTRKRALEEVKTALESIDRK